MGQRHHPPYPNAQVALSPPVSRDSVALACVAGALGRLQGASFDGADEINLAARQA